MLFSIEVSPMPPRFTGSRACRKRQGALALPAAPASPTRSRPDDPVSVEGRRDDLAMILSRV